ncbi:MAG: DUF4956 domain-containing protein [Bacteroidales bacterium]|jgi:hypothetical protein|nr:DUF4956 domain-containing protein [Bacteroidales bacterium]MCU0408322.1 DUF4956 domain-containing protein [Bacteroidales bacterium]
MFSDTFLTENNLINLLVRFSLNLVVQFVMIRLIYYRFSRKADFLFSFFIMGIVIFFICSILDSVELQLGMALGLFAVFSILRFRTVNYSVKDMTYIFAIIGISVVNSLANVPPPIVSALIINGLILCFTIALEMYISHSAYVTLVVIYDNLKLLKSENDPELLKDLSEQTGKNIEMIRIQKFDISRGIAELEVFFKTR